MHACTTHASHPQAGSWPPIPPLSFLDCPYPVISDAPLDLGSEHGPFALIRIPMQWLHGERAFFRARLPANDNPDTPALPGLLSWCDRDGDLSILWVVLDA
jgi:hypothetical protein